MPLQISSKSTHRKVETNSDLYTLMGEENINLDDLNTEEELMGAHDRIVKKI